jgi:GT2 family glycosyltransferase
MVAGALAQSGYFQGGSLHAPRAANPKGFFEAAAVNELNDALLRQVRPDLPGGQGWLCRLSPTETVPPSSAHTAAIRGLTQAPFCLKDPRFSYTLPAWRPHLSADTGLVCVFRDPLLTATSIVEEVQRASYLQGNPLTVPEALEIWASMYRQILHTHRRSGPQPWLFIHYDQMLSGSGPSRLGAFLGASVNGEFAERTMRRSPPAGTLPPAVSALYDELCQLAGHSPRLPSPAPVSSSRPDITVIAVIEDDTPGDVSRIIAGLTAQRGITAELVVVDSTTAGGVTVPSATVLRSPSASRGSAYLSALSSAQGRYIALADGRCWRLPNQLARLAEVLDAAPDAALVLSDYHISVDGDRFEGSVDLRSCIEAPQTGWMSGVLMRRAALEAISEQAFWPSELDPLKRLRGVQRVLHISEPLFSVEASALEAGLQDAARDAAAIAVAQRPWTDGPVLTVSLCTYNRQATLRECLGALCRQNIPPGAFAITIVNDGSTDGTAEMLDSISAWPVPVTVLHRPNGGLSAARNTGLSETSTPLVLFINDDTIASGDLILQHITAHQANPGGAVLGSFPQPAEACRENLTDTIESSDLMFCFNMLSTDSPNPPQFFYTCNVSVATSMVTEAGGFDEDFRHYGAEDTDLGLRLGLLGMRVHYVPSARAIHRHPYTFAYIQRRARMVAAAHIRLWRKHPDHVIDADVRVGAGPLPSALAPYEAAAATLSTVDLAALRGAGLDELADRSKAQLTALLQALNPQWWTLGLSAGLEEHGYTSLDDLLLEHPFSIPDARETVWLMVPTSDAEESWVKQVLAFRERFTSEDPVTLVLLAGVEGGYSASALEQALSSFQAPGTPHVTIVETGLPGRHAIRLFAAADRWVRTGAPSEAGWERMASAADCAAATAAPPPAPWPLATASKTRLLAWPSWTDTDLRTLLADYATMLCGQDDVTLCLRLDPQSVSDLPAAVSRLQSLAEAVLPDGGASLDVLVVEDPIPEAALPRLGRAVDGLLVLPSNTDPEQLGRALGIPVVHGQAELRARLHV